MAIESLNPFADYGGIVRGERFVGRDKELQTIEQRVLGSAYGNLAIMGLPRIGKSSLAWQGIMEKKDALLQNKTIPIFFQTGSCDDSLSFFRQMASLLDDEISMICEDERYEKFGNKALAIIRSENDPTEFNLALQKYFKLVKKLGFKVIYILDEFDSVQSFFTVANFQLLRELSYNPETKLCLVTCSRKTIQEIEAKDGAISNFYGTFSEIRLGMYDDDSFAKYWIRSSNVFSPSDEYIKQAEFYVGRHPFLLDYFNDFCIQRDLVDNIENDTILEEIRLNLLNHFNTIQDTLSHEDLLNKAIQLVLGPAFDVKKLDEEKLLKYNFIKIVDNEEKLGILGHLVGSTYQGKSYTCFSDFFTNVFEQNHIIDIDYWPLWTETEKMIRNLIKIYVTEVYGADWETAIFAKYGGTANWAKQFESIKYTREKDQKLFSRASENLIDYTMTRDMYNVFMSVAWKDWFGDVFGPDKKAWGNIFNYLADIRNPMAHNNKEFISQDEITKAQEYCDKIMKAIREWGDRRNSKQS